MDQAYETRQRSGKVTEKIPTTARRAWRVKSTAHEPETHGDKTMTQKNPQTPQSITIGQRKELSKIVEAEFERRIEEQRQKNSEEQDQLKEGVLRHVGAEVILKQIKSLGEQETLLYRKLESLGVSRYGNIENHGEARKLLEDRSKSTQSEKDLFRRKQDTLTKLWTVKTVEDAQSLVLASQS